MIPRRPKFGNKKTIVDGVTFDSAKEARRSGELRLMERAGLISELVLQPVFHLDVNGKRVASYRGDFQYRDKETGEVVVEDVKSPITRTLPEYRLKNKLMLAVHNIQIREV